MRGLRKHFWLGRPEDYPDDHLKRSEKRIIIRVVVITIDFSTSFEKSHTCEDAQAFNTEARRRVKYWREHGYAFSGNRILIMGEDINGKTDDLSAILIKAGDTFTRIDGQVSDIFSAQLLAPAPHEDDENLEEALSKMNQYHYEYENTAFRIFS
ncbi:hypothetical protein [Citrobacter youngae]|uniref:hypothetical protein n=1 Tax=Citrobacter youngae TaxID=133448 RepID=UPI003F1A0DD7